MSEKEMKEKENRLSVELLRLISFLVEYLDKSTLLMAFTFLGIVLIVVGSLLFLAGILYIYQAAVVSYGGFTTIYFSLFYKHKMKRKFDKYLEAVSSDTLMSYSEYRKYLSTIEKMLEKQYRKLLFAEKREKELAYLRSRIAQLEKENANLLQTLKQIESEKRQC